jgi:hypothetical protein
MLKLSFSFIRTGGSLRYVGPVGHRYTFLQQFDALGPLSVAISPGTLADFAIFPINIDRSGAFQSKFWQTNLLLPVIVLTEHKLPPVGG